MIFENCLFEGNSTSGIFALNYYGTSPTFSVLNCTFDNNSIVWSEDPSDLIGGFTITNCIFSNNETTFSGNNLRGKTAFSLTSEAIDNYGTGCVSSADPGYITTTRTNPSDWNITETSPAHRIGSTTVAPVTDIAGNPRDDPPDAGCWELR